MRDELGEVERMLDFLELEYNRTEVAVKLEGDFNEFRRHHSGQDYDHYTSAQKAVVNNMILETIKTLEEYKMDRLFHIRDYITGV